MHESLGQKNASKSKAYYTKKQLWVAKKPTPLVQIDIRHCMTNRLLSNNQLFMCIAVSVFCKWAYDELAFVEDKSFLLFKFSISSSLPG